MPVADPFIHVILLEEHLYRDMVGIGARRKVLIIQTRHLCLPHLLYSTTQLGAGRPQVRDWIRTAYDQMLHTQRDATVHFGL